MKSINLKRRHSRTCTSKLVFGSFTYESDEKKRGAKKCECDIHFYGTLHGEFARRSTKRSDWREAEAVVRIWASEIPVSVDTPARAKVVADDPMGKTIESAASAFLQRCENRNIKLPTMRKYQTFVRQLKGFSESRGYVYLSQLDIEAMDAFYASWRDGIRSKAKKLERLKQFVRFCLKRKWIVADITEDLKDPEGSSKPAHKSPFEDHELNCIYATCDRIGASGSGPGFRNWTGQDVRDFIDLAI